MKHLIIVGLLTLAGTAGTLFVNPFWGVAVYYTFAVLRPQYIWQWSLPPDVQWSRYVALATILAAVGAQFGLVKAPRRARGSRRSFWVITAFFLWTFLTYFTAFNKDASWPYMNEYMKIFVMMIVSSALIESAYQAWMLLALAAGSLAYISYEINSLYFFQGYLGVQKNGYGGLDNNGAGLMLAMGIPPCLLLWDGMRGRWRWLFLAAVPITIHAVLMTFSRGAMLSLIVATPLVVARCRHRKQILMVGSLLAMLAVPMMAGPEIRDRFFSIKGNDTDESANSRRASWSAGLAIAIDYPIFGVGIRNSNLFSFRYGADMEGRTIHSQYLQIAADNGFVGLGLYLASMASVWADTRGVRKSVAGRDDPESARIHATACGVETSLAVFCFGAAFLSLESFELPYLLMLLGAQSAAILGPNPGVSRSVR